MANMMELKVFIFIASLIAACSCSGDNCTGSGVMTAGSYVFQWSVQPNQRYLDVNVTVNTALNTWVAVGFSADTFMVRHYIIYFMVMFMFV